MMAQIIMNGMMTGARLDGMKVRNKLVTTPCAHFHWEVFDLGAMVGPKRFGWAKMNPDTVAAVNIFTLSTLDGGAWQFQGCDENGTCRSLNGRLTGVHKVLRSAVEIACEGRQIFSRFRWWFHDSSIQHNWPGHEDTLRQIGELVRKTTSSMSSWAKK